MTTRLIHYIDLKSPFAYLGKDEVYRFEDTYDVEVVWRHANLFIPDFLDNVESRSAHNWRKVKYAYMDARRLAKRRGLTIYGPRKVYDSTTAGVGMYWAMEQGLLRPYLDTTFERFFTHKLEVDSADDIKQVLADIGAETEGFDAWLAGEGRVLHDRHHAEGEAMGIFGVPMLVLNGELFWGTDRFWLVEEVLAALAAERSG